MVCRDVTACLLRVWLVSLLLLPLICHADYKFLQLEPMGDRGGISVLPDGSRVYVTGSGYMIFNERGEQEKALGFFAWGTNIIRSEPLPDGKFITCVRGLSPRVDLVRADGTVEKTLLSAGGNWDARLHNDINWGSPTAFTVDMEKKRFFVLEMTRPNNTGGDNTPDPNWVRVGMWDFDGKYLGDIFRYDAKAANAAENDGLRAYHYCLAVDAKRERVYVAGKRDNKTILYCYDYTGKLLKQAPSPINYGDNGAMAVLPNGNLVLSFGGHKRIEQVTADLEPLPPIEFPAGYVKGEGPRVRSFAVDAQGRLYATLARKQVVFVRWSADLKQSDVFTLKHFWMDVTFPNKPVLAGETCVLTTDCGGDPIPVATDWFILARPTDGSNLQWRRITCSYNPAAKQITFTAPADLQGYYEIVVRYGKSDIVWSNRDNEAFLQKSVLFIPAGVTRSAAVISTTGRRAFRQGEAIPLQVMRREANTEQPVAITMQLLDARGTLVNTVTLPVNAMAAVQIPASVTRRLASGAYTVQPVADGYLSYALPLDIASSEPDSPLQRIIYHEYGFSPASAQAELADIPERMAYLRDYVAATRYWGFTRETDRLANTLHSGIAAWRRDISGDFSNPAVAPSEFYNLPIFTGTRNWEAEYYLDRAAALGIRHDSHLTRHCEAYRFRDFWLDKYNTTLQRYVQWAGKYSSFYGVNYHDESFWGDWDSSWTQEDKDWLKDAAAKVPNGTKVDAWRMALRTMYDSYNSAVRQANPLAKTTTSPLWQCGIDNGVYPPENFADMSESYTHYLTEGTHQPWYQLHSVEYFRRPGLPLMGVVDNGHNDQSGLLYMKGTMIALSRGVQGTGMSFTNPLSLAGTGSDSSGADMYRTVNSLAKMYGPIYAETTPMNEAAILFSISQSVKEKTSSWGGIHWDTVYGLLGGLMMAGLPANITYEEDIKAGWLLENGKPRVPMLFLAAQTEPLPVLVRDAIAKYIAAGGKVFTDAQSAIYPGSIKLAVDGRVPALDGFANDASYPEFFSLFEKIAADLKPAVAQFRRYPVDLSDAWTTSNVFDGGAIRYLALAGETQPFPWDDSILYGLGQQYTRTYQPRTVTVSYPADSSVVYDVFDHQIIKPAIQGKTATLTANLRSFSSRLYALAPAPLGAPKLTGNVKGADLIYTIQLVDQAGKALAAQAPLRIRLVGQQSIALEIYRGTDRSGLFRGSLALPAGQWALEVSEMLGGKSSSMATGAPTLAPFLDMRTEVDVLRDTQLRELLQLAKGEGITLAMANEKILTPQQITALTNALLAQGITLTVGPTAPKTAVAGLYLATGYPGDATLGDLLIAARNQGVTDYQITANIPGAGHGFITAVYAPRLYRENAIALAGGDAAGLANTVQRFCAWLGEEPQVAAAPAANGPALIGKPIDVAHLPTLWGMVGTQFNAVTATPDGIFLAVAARGYGKNLALIQDMGAQGKIVRAQRVGAGARFAQSLYVSADGRYVGMSNREIERFGQGFHLIEAATGKRNVFAAFGDIDARYHTFAASSDGNTVIASGTYGVVCWKRAAPSWDKAWSYDYWKEFDKLDWPIDDKKERIPQFHAYIPERADYAIIVFGEQTDNGWVTPENHCSAWIKAINLADGKERWTFEVPVPDKQIFPKLFTSPDSKQLFLQIQVGSWREKSYSFMSVDSKTGKQLGDTWSVNDVPVKVAVANDSGRIAVLQSGRMLEVRNPDGTLRYSKLWGAANPLDLAFAADGVSIIITDDAGKLTRLDAVGTQVWQSHVECVSAITVAGKNIFAAGWDGRVRAFTEDGKWRWSLDCTPAMDDADPMAALVAASIIPAEEIVQLSYPANTTDQVPPGENMFSKGIGLKLTVSKADVAPALLTNGVRDDVEKPWNGAKQAKRAIIIGQQSYAQITFNKPTDVGSITVYENPRHPEAYPTDTLILNWNEEAKRWETVKRGIFLQGPVNTYTINLKAVTKLIYAPWNSYGHDFYTSEIEVR